VPAKPAQIVLRAVHGSALIFGVKEADLLGPDYLTPDVVVGRDVAMGALHMAGMSSPEIARPFHRHHTTVNRALHRVEVSGGAVRACIRQVHNDLVAAA
jgi:chromosomal replication initiation ATPase DnaA